MNHNEKECSEEILEEVIEEVDQETNEEVSDTAVTDLEEQLKSKEEEATDYLDRLQRTMAEFENFRKRTVKEKSSMYESGAKDALEPILQIVDNFERALGTLEEDQKEDSFVKGIDMIYKQFTSVLEELGVKAIEAVGNEFDPNYHSAVTHVEDEQFGDNEVVEEFQRGYMYKESVLRYSMVKVAN
ncbi:nucleotide exchange factor GrpE [Vallitalea okinawensis]|uniref:nucleotide exchange factor GrpE n=1 Tax=Vallitalea okinawensis TaxID=2078660 RepID=UPI000CFC96AD|nr:nucleotide exchange factor GrpE [Vallitalea okinawensis]